MLFEWLKISEFFLLSFVSSTLSFHGMECCNEWMQWVSSQCRAARPTPGRPRRGPGQRSWMCVLMMENGQPTQDTTKSQRNYFLKVPVLCKSDIKSANSYIGVSLFATWVTFSSQFLAKMTESLLWWGAPLLIIDFIHAIRIFSWICADFYLWANYF